jgi:hypothetical protein
MRMLLKAVVHTEAGNEGLGSAPEALDRLHEFLKPEAFYGVSEDGQRAFIAVFDLADPSQIPVVCGPIYRLTKGKITMTPCMTFEDVKKGVSSIGLSTARQVSIAGMTQPISAQAIGPPGPINLEVVMRMLLKAVLDTKAANEAFRSGAAAEALDQIQDALQPEALYGFVEEGERVFFAVFDLADASEIPVISEPLFQRANVKITLTPCMTLEDAKKGIEEAARRMADLQR